MSKKNKGGKTPSAKAARNLEALKKAKAAVEAAETPVVEQKVEEPAPVEEKKPEPKPTPASKGTVYETYLEFKKHPHMMIVSQEIKKNDKNVEVIHTTWKNTETNETSVTIEAGFVIEGNSLETSKSTSSTTIIVYGLLPL